MLGARGKAWRRGQAYHIIQPFNYQLDETKACPLLYRYISCPLVEWFGG